jgi:hypothetical protein
MPTQPSNRSTAATDFQIEMQNRQPPSTYAGTNAAVLTRLPSVGRHCGKLAIVVLLWGSIYGLPWPASCGGSHAGVRTHWLPVVAKKRYLSHCGYPEGS